MVARPSLGSSNPHSILITVDLPEPLGPRKPKMLPLAMLNDTRSTAVKCPNRLVRCSHEIIASAIGFAWFFERLVELRNSLPKGILGISGLDELEECGTY